MKIAIINGPNLNLLGKREPEIYGTRSFEDYLQELKDTFSAQEIFYFQSNHEGELIDKIQEYGFVCDALLINAAGYTHTSISIGDALAAIPCQKAEVHISNPYSRENYRHHSMLSSHVHIVVCGMGLHSYHAAISYFINGPL